MSLRSKWRFVWIQAIYWAFSLWNTWSTGGAQIIRDGWAFDVAKDFKAASPLEILVFFDLQPPGFAVLARLLSYLPIDIFTSLFALNNLVFAGTLLLTQLLAEKYFRRMTALLITFFVCTGFEFHAYVSQTRYEILTAGLGLALLAAHTFVFKPLPPEQYPRPQRIFALLGISLALAFVRSYYSYFHLCYAALLVMLLFFPQKKALPVRAKAWLITAIVLLGATPLGFSLKNYIVYDYFEQSSGVYLNLQDTVATALERQEKVFDRAAVIAELTRRQGTTSISAQALRLDAPWPLHRIDFVRARDLSGDAPPAWYRFLAERFPKKNYASPLYLSRERDNGYLLGPALRVGYEAAAVVLAQDRLGILGQAFNNSLLLATGYSSYWFLPGYGRDFLDSWRGLRDRLRTPLIPYRLPPPLALTYANYCRFFTPAFIRLHTALNDLLILPVLAGAFLHFLYLTTCLGAGYWIPRLRARYEPGTYALLAYICYSVIVGTLGDFSENMRYSIYWKIPLILYIGTAVQKLAKRLIRRRPPPTRSAA